MRKNEIERLFNEEIRDKKKTGSGSFKRTGKGVKNGIRGGMRFPYQNLSKKEQKEYTKPGKVEVFNLNDVLPIKSFAQKTQKEQKELLERWRDLYKNGEIIEKIGITKARYYALLNELNVEKNPIYLNTKKEKKKIDRSQLDQYKNQIPDYKILLGIDPSQQKELMDYYDKKYTVEQLAEKMGTSSKTLYQYRYRLNKSNEKQLTKEKNEETKTQYEYSGFLDDYLDENNIESGSLASSEKPVINLEVATGVDHYDDPTENVAVLKPDDKTHPIKNDSHQEQLSLKLEEKNNTLEPKQSATYTVTGTYFGTDISKKLKKFSDLLSGESNQFEIQLTIHEIPNSSESNESSENTEVDKEKIVQALFKMLS